MLLSMFPYAAGTCVLLNVSGSKLGSVVVLKKVPVPMVTCSDLPRNTRVELVVMNVGDCLKPWD